MNIHNIPLNEKLKISNPKINQNFQNINTELTSHINSSLSHKAENITYTGDAVGSNVKQAIDGLDTRIDTIVAQSGDDNTEIVDARGGFLVLGARLDNFDTEISKLKIIYNVKDYGAVGDGVTDDADAIQKAVDACSLTGGTVFYPPGKYLISRKIINEIKVQLPPASGNSDLFFSSFFPINHISESRASIIATASMDSMMIYQPNTALGVIGPYFSTVKGLLFDGGGLVQNNLFIEWTAGMVIEGNLFKGATNGIVNAGYGGHAILKNKFQNTKCIYLQRGGDNTITFNDFYPRYNGSCVEVLAVAGNNTIAYNVFNRDAWDGNPDLGRLVGINLVGSKRLDTNTNTIVDAIPGTEIRDVVIRDNEFAGIDFAIQAEGLSNVRNVYNSTLVNNHINAFGTHTACMLSSLYNCQDITIQDNYVGGMLYPDLTLTAIELNNCVRVIIEGNKVTNLTTSFLVLVNSDNCEVNMNKLLNIGKLGSSYAIINLFGTSQQNNFKNNKFVQNSDNFAQNGIYEHDTADYSTATENRFINVVNPYFKLGVNSIFRRVTYSSSPPSSSRWIKGDLVYNTNVLPGGYVGWVCTVDGSPGTWKGFGTVQT